MVGGADGGKVVLPFGKHKNQALDTVPSSYLLWLLRETKLSTGLRAAVADELARRGVRAPVQPPPPPRRCPRCGSRELHGGWHQFADGTRQIRGTCTSCGGCC